MVIKYDRLVLEDAKRIANYPDALQRDLARHIHDRDVLQWYPENNGPFVSYLDPEVAEEIKQLYLNLPRRESQRKFKTKTNGEQQKTQ